MLTITGENRRQLDFRREEGGGVRFQFFGGFKIFDDKPC